MAFSYFAELDVSATVWKARQLAWPCLRHNTHNNMLWAHRLYLCECAGWLSVDITYVMQEAKGVSIVWLICVGTRHFAVYMLCTVLVKK